ncbi:MAG: hypothetical protein ACOYXU_01595 [Nitrospirota bacterium]
MKSTLFALGAATLAFSLTAQDALGAHILEPLNTEIASTTARGRMFGQIEYDYYKFENGTTFKAHLLPVDFEIGVGERTQLNVDGVIALREDTAGVHESGVDELAVGVKHRFLDEGRVAPDMAFEAEYVPSAGLTGNGKAVAGTLILSKNVTPRFVLHLNGGYELETEREVEVETAPVGSGGEDVVVAITEEAHNQATWFYNLAPMFKVIPDKLMVLAEFNGRTVASGDTTMVVVPEVIAVFQSDTNLSLQNVAFKFGVPLGLTDDSPDFGLQLAISKLF